MFPARSSRSAAVALLTGAFLAGMLPAVVSAAGPTAVDDSAIVPVNASASTVDVLGNDIGTGLTISATTDGTHGTVEIAGDALSLTYTPDADYHGTDTFDYTVTDGATTDGGTVTVAVDSPPVAVDDPGTACSPPTSFGGAFPIPEDFIGSQAPTDHLVLFGNCALLHNDTDADGDPLTWEIVTQPSHGNVVKYDEEFFGYEPNPNFSTDPGDQPGGQWISDSFTYRACDAFACSAPATMEYWVAPVNDPPTFTSGSDVTVGEDSGAYSAQWATNISPGPNESDQTVSFLPDGPAGLNDPSHVFATLPAIDPTGVLTFTLNPDAHGHASVTWVAHDDGGIQPDYAPGTPTPKSKDTSPPFTFSIDVTPDAVGGADDTFTISEDPDPTPVSLAVLSNDSFPVGATITSVTQGAKGDVTIASDGLSVLYAPDPNANGSDSFTYTLDDHAGSTDTATVAVTISPIDDAPVAAPDTLTVAHSAPATAVDVLANDTDVEGDILTVTAKTNGAKGTVVITGGGTGLTYQPNAASTGSDSFTYTVDDGHSNPSVGAVSVTITNAAPVAASDSVSVGQNAPAVALPVLANDSDPDGDARTITAKTDGAHGTVVITGGGTGLTFQPTAGYLGSDSFTYTISDGHGGTAVGTVDVTVAVNHAPNAANDAGLTVPESAGPTNLAVKANDTDADGDALAITGKTNGTHGTVTITGGGTGLTYDPNQLFIGTDVFTYTISDGRGGSDSATVLLTVVKDTTKPTVTAPAEAYYAQTVGSTTTRAHISWSGADAGTGIAKYQLQVSINGGAYSTIALASATSTSINRTLTNSRTYRFRVRATDKQGNVSSYATGPAFKPATFENSNTALVYSGSWTTSATSKALGGSHRYASSTSARVSLTRAFRDVAIVATKSGGSGSAQVWIDGVLASTINLHASTTIYRQLVFHRHFSTLVSHTVEIRPIGGGRVYLDAFLLYR